MHLRHPKSELGISTLLFAATFVALAAARPTARLSDGDSVALLTAWATAVAASVWLTVSSITCCAAAVRHSGAPRFAPCALRRLVEIAVVTTAVALPALPAHAAGPPRRPRDQPVVRAPDAPVPSTAVTTPTVPKVAPTTVAPARVTPGTVPTKVAPAPRSAPASTPLPGGGTRTHVVRPGDNLWSIARRTCTSAGRSNDAELIAYWHAVIASNRATLRSGNPSLIFPGEIVTLPPLP